MADFQRQGAVNPPVLQIGAGRRGDELPVHQDAVAGRVEAQGDLVPLAGGKCGGELSGTGDGQRAAAGVGEAAPLVLAEFQESVSIPVEPH